MSLLRVNFESVSRNCRCCTLFFLSFAFFLNIIIRKITATSERLQIQKLKNSGKQCVKYICFKVDLRAVKSFFICQRAVNSPCSLKITFITTLSLVEPRQQKFALILFEDKERYSVIEVDHIKERHYACHQVVNIWWGRGKEAKYFPPKLLKCGKPNKIFIIESAFSHNEDSWKQKKDFT